MSRGKLIVIEGTDGVGKRTQHEQLVAKFASAKYEVLALSFPQYGHTSAAPLESYLRDEEISPISVAPLVAAPLFAIDHASANHQIHAAQQAGTHVLLDRFIVSNLAHQGAKLKDASERHRFYEILSAVEHLDLSVPHPDLNIIIDLPAEISHRRAKKRASAKGEKLDGHETDLSYQNSVRQAYHELAKRDPQCFALVSGMDGDRELEIPEIHKAICAVVWDRLQIKL